MNRIRARRLKLAAEHPAAFSIVALAHRLGVGESTVRRWEDGSRRPSRRHARKLARELGLPIEELLQPAVAPTEGDDSRLNRSEDGRPILAGAIIPHPDGRPELLMALHVWHATSAWSWLGGHVRPGEDPEDAVRRELAEELDAVGVHVVRLLGVVDTHIDTSRWFGPRYERGHVGYHYLVTVESPDVSVIDHEELTRVEWLTLDQVAEAVATLPEEIREADLRFAHQAVAGQRGPAPRPSTA